MYTAAAVRCGVPRGCRSQAELMHCLACAMLSEAQGSGESREACITPSEVDKVHQWPIYSTVQYQASSALANTQWEHGWMWREFHANQNKVSTLIQEFCVTAASGKDTDTIVWSFPLRHIMDMKQIQIIWVYLYSYDIIFSTASVVRFVKQSYKKKVPEVEERLENLQMTQAELELFAASILRLHLTTFMHTNCYKKKKGPNNTHENITEICTDIRNCLNISQTDRRLCLCSGRCFFSFYSLWGKQADTHERKMVF